VDADSASIAAAATHEKETTMNQTLRAIAFGAAVAVVTTLTLNTVYAAQPEVVRLDTIYVTAHKDATDADGNLKVTRLDTIVVTAHKNIA
jgi:hypothetical protein